MLSWQWEFRDRVKQQRKEISSVYREYTYRDYEYEINKPVFEAVGMCFYLFTIDRVQVDRKKGGPRICSWKIPTFTYKGKSSKGD